MRRSEKSLKKRILLMMCTCLCVLTAAAASNIETDEDGGVWNYDNNTYTDPEGNVYEITEGGVQEDDTSSVQVDRDDGSIVIITSDEDSVTHNSDGSIDVESGQIRIEAEEPTRPPIEGEDYQNLLKSVSDRNGAYTPTVWIDPVTGQASEAEVVYTGIGRSMVQLNGQQKLVNTVDLRWQTEAPEDKVLAVVRSRYVWLRKKPSNAITNPKFMQVYRDSVLRVLSTGKNWTFVDYKGIRAYVVTSGLEFFCNDHTEIEAGYISYKGNIKGNTPIQVRDLDTKKILESYKVGTPVTIFDVLDDWTEIDVEGWHCVIRNEYVTYEKELASAK